MDIAKNTHLLKNIPGRTIQLGLVGLVISLFIAIYFYALGLKMSATMVTYFTVALAAILVLQFFKVLKEAHHIIIGAVCILLIISGFVEGSVTGQYFYFFPLIVVIPVVVDSKNAGNTEFILTFSGILISFAVCFYVGHTSRPLESIPAGTAEEVIYSNAATAILTTLLFSVANIFYEKKFIKALRTIAHIQSHEMRKPVASIIGLMDVWKSEEYEYNEEIILMMEDAVSELDQKIHFVINQTSV